MFTDSIPSDEFTVCLLYYLFKVALISLAHAHGYARTPQLQTREKAGLSECSKRTAQRVRRLLYNVICSFTRSYIRRDVISGNEVPPFKNNKNRRARRVKWFEGLSGYRTVRSFIYFKTADCFMSPQTPRHYQSKSFSTLFLYLTPGWTSGDTSTFGWQRFIVTFPQRDPNVTLNAVREIDNK